jgi:chaperonin GroES
LTDLARSLSSPSVGTPSMRVPVRLRTPLEANRMNLKPLGDRIIVEVLEEEETTVSGIVLPDTAKEKPQRGTVLAVGPGRYEDGKLVPLDVATGDEIIYSKYGGTEVKVGLDEYLILRESDVLAKVDKAAKKTKVKA